MKCPTCDVKLIDGGRPGVAGGYCPECEGEWFPRGAVDYLLDRAGLTAVGGTTRPTAGGPAPPWSPPTVEKGSGTGSDAAAAAPPADAAAAGRVRGAI